MNASRKLAVASEIGRRQFVNLLGDAVAWPVIAVQAQQGGRVQHPLALDRRDETVRHRNQIWHGCGQQNAGAVPRVAQRDAKQVLE